MRRGNAIASGYRHASLLMADWDLLLTDARIATLRAGADDYGVIDDGVVAIRDGDIAWLGPRTDAPRKEADETRSLGGRWITPALIDCHTHLVFGGDRAAEFEQRLAGASYEDIAAQGGGILSTVRATRAADIDTLYESALRRLHELAAGGVATVEIKSGYGLNVSSELRQLAVARNLGESSGLSICTTLLAAHTVPPEFEGKADAYIDLICNELLPEVVERELADAVDAYCERIAFEAPQVAKLFRAARAAGLPVKLHADQLSDGGGGELAAHFNALSADHLEYTPESGIKAMAQAGTVAVLLPGAFLTLGETQKPPIDAMREHGVPMALATDCNPGTSPLCSVPFAMSLGARLFGLTPLECLAGVTREAARALGLDDRGTLEAGKRADIAVWNVEHPRDLAYWMGASPLHRLLVHGLDFQHRPATDAPAAREAKDPARG
ncbi:MAG: imidazolonepropionase [Woeseiaceae bacterium]|nr:imidazolonepropionase [Woeseiaceae bacterium]